MLPAPIAADLDAHLEELSDRTMIRPGASTFAGEQALRFTHILVRDAAYEQMLKETRAELHERFASWVQRQAGERAGEYEEILGYHLEQAHRYLDDLGPLDEHGVELAQLAATRSRTRGVALWRAATFGGGEPARAGGGAGAEVTSASDPTCCSSSASRSPRPARLAAPTPCSASASARRGADCPYLSYRDGNGRQKVFDLEANRACASVATLPTMCLWSGTSRCRARTQA